jgi:hypothetical protein
MEFRALSSARRRLPPIAAFRRLSRRCALASLGLMLTNGCKPIEVVQPVAPGQQVMAPPQLFGAPPVVSGQGVMIDPFAMDPNNPMSAGAPIVVPGDGGSSQIHIPVANRDWTWEQIVDTVDDYFRIERERQVQLVGDVLTEGRIDVHPQIGATLPELHRRDSVGRYNRWESTFQTIRRRATIRVIPDATGYLVDVLVEKDLEDLPRPENSTAGAATFRNDSSLPSAAAEAVSRTRLASNWIFIGRDPELEQAMIADLQSRLVVAPAAPIVAP